MSFPRLNALAYWLYLFGTAMVMGGFLTPGGAADFGWFAYAPLSDSLHSPGIGGNLWVVGLAISGLGTILGGVNMITTILTLRAPGMTMFRMPIMTWNILVTSLLVILVFPFFAAALFALAADRVIGAHVFDVDTGGPMLWQHLFWFFGHPEVYIVALPFFGIITEVIPVFSRKPVFGYKGLVAATLLIAALSMSVWAHHMFVTGQVLLPFFSFLSFLIAVPTGMKFFVWIGTMWRGQISFETPMMFAIGFLVTFLFGGLSGVLLAVAADRFSRVRLVLRDRALPLRAVRHDRVRGVRRHLLLVPEDVRPDARRPPREDPLLAHVPRLPRHVPGAALAGHRGHAPPVRRLPAVGRVHLPEHVLDDRLVRARHRHAAVHLQRVEVVQGRPDRDRRRPVGPRQLARVGHLDPAAAAQLRPHAAHPLGTARPSTRSSRTWPPASSPWPARPRAAPGRSPTSPTAAPPTPKTSAPATEPGGSRIEPLLAAALVAADLATTGYD